MPASTHIGAERKVRNQVLARNTLRETARTLREEGLVMNGITRALKRERIATRGAQKGRNISNWKATNMLVKELAPLRQDGKLNQKELAVLAHAENTLATFGKRRANTIHQDMVVGLLQILQERDIQRMHIVSERLKNVRRQNGFP